MTSQRRFFITHLVVPESLPAQGLLKLFFYTTVAGDYKQKEYFWGTGNNTSSSEDMRRKVKQGQLIELESPEPLEPKMGLWVDPIGAVFYAPLVMPVKEKRRFIVRPLNLSPASMEYRNSKLGKKAPKPSYEMEVPTA